MQTLSHVRRMILSFGSRDTARLFQGIELKKVPVPIQEKAYEKLIQIHAAASILFLRNPPSNRLERLQGKLKDFYSVRVNDQWRIIFRFESGNAYDVEFMDYH